MTTYTRSTCPACDTSLRGIAGKPGSRLTCPGCHAQYRVAARETVLHLDRVQGAVSAPATPPSPLASFWLAHKGWLIALMILTALAPHGILIWAAIAGVMWFNHAAEPALVIEHRDVEPEPEPAELLPAAPRTSKLAILGLLAGLALLMGGVALTILSGAIGEEMLFLSPSEMAGPLVGIAAGIVPAFLVLALATTARRRCRERDLGGRGLATSAALMCLLFLGGLGHTFYTAADQMVRWRTIDGLARQQDRRTLDALETEILRPASAGSRHQAARLLAHHAPERAIAMLSVDERPAARRAALSALYHSPHRDLAVDAARQIAEARPNTREAAIARRFFQRPTRTRHRHRTRHHHEHHRRTW